MRLLRAFLALLIIGGTPVTAQSGNTVVFAAASLRGVLEDIATSAEAEVVFSFGGSGGIARQVALGAPADLVILASTQWMNWLAEQDALGQYNSVDIARNQLVLIAAADAPPLSDLSQLPARLGTDRLAIGHRDAVPAGTYAREWLQSAGLWDALTPQLAETDSVRAALALVARGEAPFGVVYATDAIAQPLVSVAYHVPDAHHSAILYPAVALSDRGLAFLGTLQGPASELIWARHGFLAVNE